MAQWHISDDAAPSCFVYRVQVVKALPESSRHRQASKPSQRTWHHLPAIAVRGALRPVFAPSSHSEEVHSITSSVPEDRPSPARASSSTCTGQACIFTAKQHSTATARRSDVLPPDISSTANARSCSNGRYFQAGMRRGVELMADFAHRAFVDYLTQPPPGLGRGLKHQQSQSVASKLLWKVPA